ncbi:NADH-dependent flavin oxidoreductase [Vagococcus sp.]|uniref:NADH-dependent flavin oxidoreductase n=1 Tax=Vagococcus sp. TaxID=1933889 RepID=UPI0010DED7DA|nr:NADH-dependent flavin oxidoreductase [Listeria monocytogenes]EAD4370564.1 NADH-dependent flavin oxidoreductase [Listeria monocytogenes]
MSDNKFKEKIQFASKASVKNRLVMSPMTTTLSFHNGKVTSDEVGYYGNRSGDVGMVITGTANINSLGKGYDGELSVESDEMIPSLAKIAYAIKRNGTKAILQIFHVGRTVTSTTLKGKQPVSASSIPQDVEGAEIPRELSEEEIQQIIVDFELATIRAIKAGFDGVEIHGANNYLIQQFFSPHSNRRMDKWGGSKEKRYLFVKEVIDSVNKAVETMTTEPFIVGYRFSPEEPMAPGITIEDTLYLVDKLANEKLDYLHVSLSKYNKFPHSKNYQEKSVLEYIYTVINKRIPLISVGGVKDSKDVNNALEFSDMVAIGKQMIIDPRWAGKVLNGKDHLIRPYIVKEERNEFIPDALWDFMQPMFKGLIK